MERMSQRLAARMKSQFVGRTDELALVESLLRAGDQGAAVFVHGPGGVGKTTLLRRLAVLADEVGRHVVRVDGRDVPPIPAAFVAAIAAAAGVGRYRDGITRGQGWRGREYERQRPRPDPGAGRAQGAGPPRRHGRAARPAGPLAAGGSAALPGRRHRRDPCRAGATEPRVAHRPGLARPHPSAPPGEPGRRRQPGAAGPARSPPEAQDKALEFTRGHPLALALVADVAENGRVDVLHGTNPAVVSALLGSLVDSVPSATHRVALEICAQVLTTTEPLLAALLGVEDAHDVFGWLRGLSIVETGPRGLFPHDLARDTLGSELRWRHPEQHADIHRRAGAYYREQFYLVDPSLQQQVLVEYVFLHRENPVLGPFVTSSAGSGLDLRSLVAVPRAARGRRVGQRRPRHGRRPRGSRNQAALLDHWMRRQPGSVQQVVGPDGDRLGLVAMLSLAEVTDEDRARDPAVAAVAAHLDTLAPLGPGEVAVLFRFWMTADGYQDLGPVQLFITLQFVRAYMATPGLAQSYVYYADPDLWAPICAYSDMQRIAAADFTVGGRTYGVFGHDWRATPPLDLAQAARGTRDLAGAAGRGRRLASRCTAPAVRVGTRCRRSSSRRRSRLRCGVSARPTGCSTPPCSARHWWPAVRRSKAHGPAPMHCAPRSGMPPQGSRPHHETGEPSGRCTTPTSSLPPPRPRRPSSSTCR